MCDINNTWQQQTSSSQFGILNFSGISREDVTTGDCTIGHSGVNTVKIVLKCLFIVTANLEDSKLGEKQFI